MLTSFKLSHPGVVTKKIQLYEVIFTPLLTPTMHGASCVFSRNLHFSLFFRNHFRQTFWFEMHLFLHLLITKSTSAPHPLLSGAAEIWGLIFDTLSPCCILIRHVFPVFLWEIEQILLKQFRDLSKICCNLLNFSCRVLYLYFHISSSWNVHCHFSLKFYARLSHNIWKALKTSTSNTHLLAC